MSENDSLRSRIVKGGAYLSARQAIGTAISIAGVLLLTRIIGPAQYGLYAASIGIYLVAQMFAQLGINVYLIRSEQDIDSGSRATATAMSLALGLLITGIVMASAASIESLTRLGGLAPIVVAVFAALPIAQLAQVPMAM